MKIYKLKSIRDKLYNVLDIVPRENLEDFFKANEIKNDKGEYPKQKKITDGEKGDLYHIKVPKDIKFEDIKKYEYEMKVFYKRSVKINEMKLYDRYMTIELYHPKYEYNLEEFFKNVGLKNCLNEYVKQDFTDYEEGKITCYMSNQDGLTVEDFMIHKQKIENKYYCEADIKYDKGKIKIDLKQKK